MADADATRDWPASEAARSGGVAQLVGTTGLMMATALQAADALIVNVALPQLERDLGGIGLGLGTWVMTSYLCATAVTAPLTAWARRRYGTSRLFRGAVIAFIATSLLCGVAPSVGVMILLRILQGAAGGLILPLVQAILLDIYPQHRHGRVLGILGAVFMLGPIVGPLLGGIATDLASWRAAFFINLPLGLVILAITRHLRYPEDTKEQKAVDLLGMLLLIVTVGALQLSLERSVGRSWLHSPELIGEALACILAFSAMVLRARHSGFSVFRPDIFKDVNFSVAAFYNFMTSGLVFVVIVFLPALGEGPLGYSATLAGFTIVPRAILLMLMLAAMGEVVGKVDYRILLTAGWLMMSAGCAILARIQPADGLIWLIAGSTIQSAGAGLLFTPHTTLAYSTLAPELRTDASGLFSLLRQLGYASGVALMAAVLRARIDINLFGTAIPPSGAAPPAAAVDAATLQAYRDCFMMLAVASRAVVPGIFLFRFSAAKAAREKAALKKAA
jgi:MFS transporter, DHA2 family, multidrug resistance protein